MRAARGAGVNAVLAFGGVALAVTSVAISGPLFGAGPVVSAQRRQNRGDFVHQRFLELEGYDGTEQRVVVTYPRRGDGRSHPPDERYPVVVALHGRTESRLPPNRGAMAWYLQYHLPAAFGAFARGRVGMADYRGLVTQPHLAMVNAQLRARDYRGVMVVTPYTPDLMAERPGSERRADYFDWLAGPLLEEVRDEFPQAARGPAATGIDGVSLGGVLALEAGFAHPEAFGAIGGIQPAVAGAESRIVAAAERARRRDDGAPALRLLTSTGDSFREATEGLSRRLRESRVSHRLVIMPGPHDYVFNQGPGAMELLRFFEEVLAREPME